ncbi:unnamed protein product, partial [Fusarium fujikuroi]
RRKTAQEVAQKMEDDMAQGLRTLLGPKATWRSEKQAESMRATMSRKTDQTAINVLPTGAGKSILFMVPVVMQLTGTSIAVVPYVALMAGLLTRATAMGVDCIQYRTSMSAGRGEVPRAARLVVVSADIVSSDQFFGYADGLLCAGLLKRIFIDECHTVIMDISYRAKLGSAGQAREGNIGRAHGRSDRTARQGRQKGVLYCRSKKKCEAIAEDIGCGFIIAA